MYVVVNWCGRARVLRLLTITPITPFFSNDSRTIVNRRYIVVTYR